ncbi:right-handed parallel beta-helix repeat-containing protein [Methanobrevibacter sp.]|uniref:right-handed parallel beta-helix repeat-containing protein n=1 Tax=Methanobrevibacter sp. TaxID=66852 RepID=UPI00397720B3
MILFFSVMLVNVAYAEDDNSKNNYNDSNFDYIQKLIDESSPGDSIYLENQTYFGEGTPISIKKDISIYGFNSTLNANDKSNIFVVSRNVNVNIVGLAFTNGYSDGVAGAISNAGKLSIVNSTLINTNSERGAIYCFDKSELTIQNSVLTKNTAISGAAIENDNPNGNVKIINTTFTDNICEEGGAIYNIWGPMQVYNSTFINNTAQRGGAIYNNRGTLKVYNSLVFSNFCDDLGAGIKSWGICEVYDSIIVNNTNTKKQGGGFYVSEFNLKIQNCLVENNTAVWGGGVYVEAKANLNVINSTLTHNSAERGGGIDLNQGTLTLTDSTVSNNLALDEGGAIRCSFMPSQIQNSIIENNVAKIGGGIYIDGVEVKIIETQLNNNSANAGGAFYNTGKLALKNISLNNNKAGSGGAIYSTQDLNIAKMFASKNIASINGGVIYNSGKLDVDKLTAIGNEAYFGGAIYADNSIKVNNSIFSSNKASEAGAIYAVRDLTIENSQFSNNKITRKGGALSVGGGNVIIANSLFELHNGADEGGCIFIYNACVYVNNTQFISNKAKSYGGAIDNGGQLTIENSLFNNNLAYGAGSIDNGGQLDIINSNFTNNKATKNGGAIDNKGNMTVIGSIFENNIAEGDGGAIIARRSTVVSHSIIVDNYDSNGYAIFNSTWDNVSVNNNWWGSNKPDFDKLLNFNTSDDFNWILMSFSNSTKLIQGKSAGIIVTFNEVIDKNGSVLKLESCEKLPVFKVSLPNGDVLSVKNGNLNTTISIPKINVLKAICDNESISLTVDINPDTIKRITENKNVVVDYNGKATFKVRVIGDDGKAVGKGIAITMKVGKTSYNVKTDKKGYATKTFDFVPGKYVVVSLYKGYSVKNTLIIKKVLSAKSKTSKKAKKIKFTAALKTSKGKAIAGKTVSFKIKGKTYLAKTNKKGIATVDFKNLKVGKYSVIVKYLKSQVKTTLKVKK